MNRPNDIIHHSAVARSVYEISEKLKEKKIDTICYEDVVSPKYFRNICRKFAISKQSQPPENPFNY